ncbi:MAG TPA: hypothetical protein VFF33_05855 [Ignavibacteriaceae bacterium]|nr:hypothetical protein [Ignavibacteriaceae bacterium]
MIYLYSLVVWFIILILAILNGSIRQFFLIPRVGELTGHQISSVLLSLFVFILSYFYINWIKPISSSQLWLIGIQWFLMTITFEFLFGHYVFGNSWQKLFADYNLLAGRIWILVLLSALTAPYLCSKLFR